MSATTHPSIVSRYRRGTATNYISNGQLLPDTTLDHAHELAAIAAFRLNAILPIKRGLLTGGELQALGSILTKGNNQVTPAGRKGRVD